MPIWQWQLSGKILNFQEKHFLAYIWWCGDRGCRDWNYFLAKKFRRHRSTIKRWILHLQELNLVNVQWPHTKSRTIYRQPFFKAQVWYAQKRKLTGYSHRLN